jgi:hypothetical protein
MSNTSDFFGSSGNTSIDLGVRLTNIKTAPIQSDSCFSFRPDNTLSVIPISSYGKSLLSVNSLNGLINLINQQDSEVNVEDTGSGVINFKVDNEIIGFMNSTGFRLSTGKVLDIETITNSSGITTFTSLVLTNSALLINNGLLPYDGSNQDIGSNLTKFNNVYANNLQGDLNTIRIYNTNSAEINFNSNLICNGGLYINNDILPYTGGFPTPQNIGSVPLPFENIYANNSYLNRIKSPSHTTGSLVFTDSEYLTTIKSQEADNDTNYKNLYIKSGGVGELLLQNNNLTYMRNFYNPAYIRPDGIGSDSNRLLNIEAGHIIPLANLAYSIGAPSLRYDTIYTQLPPNHNSDRNLKKNIQTIDFGLDFLNKLNPVSYIFKDGGVRQHWGFIAQDLRDILSHKNNKNNFGLYTYTPETEIEIKNEDGSIEKKIMPENFGVRYSELISPIVKSIQELSNKVDNLENNTNVVGDTVILNQTQPVNSSSQSSTQSSTHLQKKLDEIISRVFTLENSSFNKNEEEEESEGDFSMINSLQSRLHTLEQQNQKLENKLKKLTTIVNKILKNQ